MTTEAPGGEPPAHELPAESKPGATTPSPTEHGARSKSSVSAGSPIAWPDDASHDGTDAPIISSGSSDSSKLHNRPAARARSHTKDHASRRSDQRPPSPGVGENSRRYSPEPRQITGVIVRSIAVTPTTATLGPSFPARSPHSPARALGALADRGVSDARHPTNPIGAGAILLLAALPPFIPVGPTKASPTTRRPRLRSPAALSCGRALTSPGNRRILSFIRRPSYRHPIRFLAGSLVEDSRTSPPRQDELPSFVRHGKRRGSPPREGCFSRTPGGAEEAVHSA